MNSRVQAKLFCSIFLSVAIISLIFIGESLAGGKGGEGGDDIILYNGNIVMRASGGKGGRGGKGKGKGGGGGSIVLAHSPSMEFIPYMGGGFEHGGHGGYGQGGGWRRRR